MKQNFFYDFITSLYPPWPLLVIWDSITLHIFLRIPSDMMALFPMPFTSLIIM